MIFKVHRKTFLRFHFRTRTPFFLLFLFLHCSQQTTELAFTLRMFCFFFSFLLLRHVNFQSSLPRPKREIVPLKPVSPQSPFVAPLISCSLSSPRLKRCNKTFISVPFPTFLQRNPRLATTVAKNHDLAAKR